MNHGGLILLWLPNWWQPLLRCVGDCWPCYRLRV